jgi:putative acetyltransferase
MVRETLHSFRSFRTSAINVREEVGLVLAKSQKPKARSQLATTDKGMQPLQIRDERPGDADPISRVHREAFGGGVEPCLVDLLRDRNKAVVSLVAVVNDEIVGHVLFSPVTVDGPIKALGLAPIGVVPAKQRRGIGSSLIREGLRRCAESGYECVVLIGEPRYYQRFGFQPAHRYGLTNQYGVVDEFMVLALREGVVEQLHGLVRYAPEFKEAEGGSP